MVRSCVLILFLVVVCFSSVLTAAQDWNQFRGPDGQGVAPDSSPAINWDQQNNITWKTPIPGRGWSSPIILKDRIYLTTAIEGKTKEAASLRAVCLDMKNGNIIWDREVFGPQGLYRKHGKSSHASPTPIAADDRVYVHFGHMGTACLDVDGKVLWRRTDLLYDPYHGNGSSPMLVDDNLIFNCDGDKGPFVVALNKVTGEVAWKVDRPETTAKNKFSFCTPLLIEHEGRSELISPASGAVFAYNPDDGKVLWRVDYGSGFSVIPRPLYGHGMVFVGSSFGDKQVYAILPGGNGNVTETHIAWQSKNSAPMTPSMLLAGDELYYFSDKGKATCVDARTGKLHWQQRLKGNFSASPVFAAGRIYISSEKGKTFVIKAGKQFELLAENDLAEPILASPALAGDAMFVRTKSALYRIEGP